MVDAHQTGTVRKHGFDLQQVDHVGDALHDVAFLQHAGRSFHNLFHGLAFTRSLQCRGRNIGYGLRIIQFQPFFHTPFGDHTERKQHQLVNLFRCQVHSKRFL